jgi:hypothetical protein
MLLGFGAMMSLPSMVLMHLIVIRALVDVNALMVP